MRAASFERPGSGASDSRLGVPPGCQSARPRSRLPRFVLPPFRTCVHRHKSLSLSLPLSPSLSLSQMYAPSYRYAIVPTHTTCFHTAQHALRSSCRNP